MVLVPFCPSAQNRCSTNRLCGQRPVRCRRQIGCLRPLSCAHWREGAGSIWRLPARACRCSCCYAASRPPRHGLRTSVGPPRYGPCTGLFFRCRLLIGLALGGPLVSFLDHVPGFSVLLGWVQWDWEYAAALAIADPVPLPVGPASFACSVSCFLLLRTAPNSTASPSPLRRDERRR